MSAITDDEVVERVAEAIHDQMTETEWWPRERAEIKERYRKIARFAIRAHREAYETPYVDADHQGGNLLDFVILVSARAHRAEEELAAVRAFCVKKAGKYLPEDATTLKAVELLQNAVEGWKGLAKTYGDKVVCLREELAEAQDSLRLNDFATLQEQYTKAMADLVLTREKLFSYEAGELDGELYRKLMALAGQLQSETRTGQEKGTPNEIAWDDGYSGGRVNSGEELEALLTPRPSTFSVELERTKAELEKIGLALTNTSRALGEAQAELGRRQRQGQAAVNVLNIVRPDLFAAVTATGNDPFHDDTRLPQFFTWLADVVLAEQAQARMDNDNDIRHELSDVTKEFGLDA